MKRKYIAILTFVWVFAHGLQAKAVPGVTDDTIKVGTISDMSGPAAFYGRELLDGLNLYLDHINDQGGVHGRKIVLLHEDDGYQPSRSVAAFRKLHDRDRVFCFSGNFGSSTVMATLPLFERTQVPLIGVGNFNSKTYSKFRRNVFGIGPDYKAQSWMILKYILDTWEGAGSPRIAVVYQDDDYGQDGLSGLREAMDAYGLDLVAEESHKRGTVDFSSQILSLKSKEPTHVVLWTIYRETAAILKKANQMKLECTFVGGAPTADSKVVELAGEDSDGFLALGNTDLWSESANEELSQYRKLTESAKPSREVSMMHSYGYSMAEVLVEGLRRAGRELTREKLVEALETIRNFETASMMSSYGPKMRGGATGRALILKASPEKGRFEAVTDWLIYDSNTEIAKR